MHAQLATALILTIVLACTPGSSPEEGSTGEEGAVDAQQTAGAGDAPLNTLTAEEEAAGWRLLFDGTSFAGWRGYRLDQVPAGWSVESGAVRFAAPTDPAEGERGDLMTEDEFENFELALEYRVSPGGNSGVFFRVSEDQERSYHSGPEFQILDDAGHRDGQDPLTSTGSNYALHAPSEKVALPAASFNAVLIRVEGDRVEHWLNGTRIVEYRLWDEDWEERVAASKFADMPRYGRNRSGHIVLQDHGDEVWFRNLKIRPL